MHSTATAMASRGHEVTVITGLPHYPMGTPHKGFGRWKPLVREEDGIRVIRVPLIMASNRQPVLRVLGFISFALCALPWVLFSHQADVLIASVPPITVSGLGLLCAWLRRWRFVVVLRDVEPVATLKLRRMIHSPLGRILVVLSMWIYRRADRIVVVHATERDAVLEHRISPDVVETISHGVDMEGFSKQSRLDIPFSLPRRSGNTVALYVGTIGEAHDLKTLIASAGDSRIRRLPLDFVIVGDGEQARECQTLIGQKGLNNVRLLPPIPLEWVPASLAQADILICSFHRRVGDALGSKIYEYCASGNPILVHGGKETAELVHKIGNGLTCKPGNPDELYHALHRFLSEWDSWCDRGKRGLEYAARHFSQADRSSRWGDILTKLTLKRRKGR
jgi:glycosyltransferase involved in cell wall biosynthesis